MAAVGVPVCLNGPWGGLWAEGLFCHDPVTCPLQWRFFHRYTNRNRSKCSNVSHVSQRAEPPFPQFSLSTACLLCQSSPFGDKWSEQFAVCPSRVSVYLPINVNIVLYSSCVLKQEFSYEKWMWPEKFGQSQRVWYMLSINLRSIAYVFIFQL